MPIQKVDVSKVQELHENSDSVILLDVRERDEFRNESIAFAQNFPLSELDVGATLEALNIDQDQATTPLYFICRGGSRSESAAKKFHQSGYQHVYNVEGGMIKWLEQGLPTRKN